MPDLLSLSIMICSQGIKLAVKKVAECLKGISLVNLWSVFSLLPCPAYEKRVEEIPHPQNMKSSTNSVYLMKQLFAMQVISADAVPR